MTVDSFLPSFGLALLMFTSTNLDDVFVLLALFSNPALRPADVIVGQLLGMGLLVALSIAGAVLALAIAPAYVGLLGLAPLGLGIIHLVQRHADDDDEEEPRPEAGGGSLMRVSAVTLVTLANGGDNLGVYIPMFTTAQRSELIVYAVTMIGMTGVWCWLAHALIHHPRLNPPIRRYVEPLTPFVLIALGLYILIESRAYAVLSAFSAG